MSDEQSLDQAPMSLKQLKAKNWEETGVTVGRDDPILIMRVIQQLTLDEYENLLKTHSQAITVYMGQSAEVFTKNVQQSILEFKQEILTESLRERLIMITELTSQNKRLLKQTKRQSKIMAILTVINLTSVALAAVILLTFFR